MLLHCDFVYADSEDITMSLPFINLGLVPEAASTMLLPKTIGHQKAAELLTLGDNFSAHDAKELGFITEICPSKTALDTAKETSKKPRDALLKTKELLKRDAEPIADRLSEEAKVFKKCLKSDETKEALSAFMEKHKPNFSKFRK